MTECVDVANKSFIKLKIPKFFYSEFFLFILIIKTLITLFAFFIYSRFTPFVDASLYLCSGPSCYIGTAPLRTEFVYLFFQLLRKLLQSDLSVHLLISSSLAYVLWYVFKKNYHFLSKPLFYAALCLPHFLIWTGMVGKEALAIAGFLLLIRACVDLIFKNRLKIFPLILGLFLSLMIRPHYAFAYLYLFLVTLFFSHVSCKTFESLKITTLFLLGFSIVSFLFLFVFWEYFAGYLYKFMIIIKYNYFLSQVGSRANRLDISWTQSSDFIFNLWWGLPMSIVGPTLREVLARPLILPAFIEGVFSLSLLGFITFKIIKCAFENPKYNAVIMIGFVPAILMALLANYPFGIFNPGSAIRYKQCFAPLFYFYPILLMSEIKKRKYLESNHALIAHMINK